MGWNCSPEPISNNTALLLRHIKQQENICSLCELLLRSPVSLTQLGFLINSIKEYSSYFFKSRFHTFWSKPSERQNGKYSPLISERKWFLKDTEKASAVSHLFSRRKVSFQWIMLRSRHDPAVLWTVPSLRQVVWVMEMTGETPALNHNWQWGRERRK